MDDVPAPDPLVIVDDQRPLLEQLARAEADRDTYRTLAHEAITRLYGVTQDAERAHLRIESLLAQLKTLRRTPRQKTKAVA